MIILGSCKYVTLLGKRDIADVIKLRILGWGDYLGLSQWVQYNRKDPCKREAGGSGSENVRCDDGDSHARPPAEERGQLLEAEKGKETYSPLEPC